MSYGIADRTVTRLAGPGWWYEESERLRWFFGTDCVFGKNAEARRAQNRRLVAEWRRRKVAA